MRCSEALQDVVAAWDGRPRSAEVAEHLASCPACAARENGTRRLAQAWDATRPPSPTGPAWDAAWSRIAQGVESPAAIAGRPSWPRLGWVGPASPPPRRSCSPSSCLDWARPSSNSCMQAPQPKTHREAAGSRQPAGSMGSLSGWEPCWSGLSTGSESAPPDPDQASPRLDIHAGPTVLYSIDEGVCTVLNKSGDSTNPWPSSTSSKALDRGLDPLVRRGQARPDRPLQRRSRHVDLRRRPRGLRRLPDLLQRGRVRVPLWTTGPERGFARGRPSPSEIVCPGFSKHLPRIALGLLLVAVPPLLLLGGGRPAAGQVGRPAR